MSAPKPDSSQASGGPSVADSAGRVPQVISTAAVFAATLDRLNRNSTLALVQALATEVEKHTKRLSSASSGSEEVQQLRGELLAFLGHLHKAMEQHHREAALTKQQLTELQEGSAKMQSEFGDYLRSLISDQMERQLSILVTRDFKPLTVRLEHALTHRKRTRWLSAFLLLLLILTLVGSAFAIGFLTGRKSCAADYSMRAVTPT